MIFLKDKKLYQLINLMHPCQKKEKNTVKVPVVKLQLLMLFVNLCGVFISVMKYFLLKTAVNQRQSQNQGTKSLVFLMSQPCC